MELDQLKPKLKPCSIVDDGVKLILEDEKQGRPVVLPADRKPLLDLLGGELTVREIIGQLIADRSTLNFRAIFTTLTALDQAQYLEEPLGIGAEAGGSKSPVDRAEAFFMRPLFELKLASHLRVALMQNRVLLIVAMLVVLGFAADSVIYWLSHSPTRAFLYRAGTYRFAIADLILLSSVLMIARGIGKVLFLLFSTGQAYNVRLRVHAFGLSLDASDTSTYSIASTGGVLVYSTGVALVYLFAASLWPELVPGSALTHSFETLAIFFTFLDLDPYRKSQLTLVLDRVFKEDDLRHLTAYLKNRALFSAASANKSVRGETRLVLYSAAALAWTIGFFLFALDALSANYANLILTIQNETGIERISALVVLAVLSVVMGSLVFDLLGTIVRNVVYPAITPYLKVVKKLRSKDIKTFDKLAIKVRLKALSLFSDFNDAALDQLVGSVVMREYKTGTRIIVQGEPGREMYVLLEGAVEVLKREETGLTTHICKLGQDSVFGEIALLKECTRTADIVATQDIKVLVIEKAALQKALSASGFSDDYDRLIDKVALGHYLSSAPLFRELPPETLGVFARRGELERRSVGETVVREGEQGRTFYLVLRGELDVTKDGSAVGALKQGDFFGEISLLTSAPRTATVAAKSEVLLLKLEAGPFWRVLSENLQLAMSLETIAEQRLA